MIYLVTNNETLSNNETYSIISIEKSLELLQKLTIIGLDTETTGLDCHTNELLLVQLGCKDFQIVIDCKTVDILAYKDFLESEGRTFIGWNLMSDLQWFYERHIIIKKVSDGMLAEKLLWLGYPAKSHSMSLKTASQTYLNIDLDKTIRGKIIWSKVLSNDIIQYAADDVKYLEEILLKQRKLLIEKELITALSIENRFVRVLAYVEWCGVKIDTEKWKSKIQQDQQTADLYLNQCNQWLINNYPSSKYIYIDRQGDLFEGFDLSPKVNINWESPKQVVELFKFLGIDTFNEETNSDTVDIKKLTPQINKCSLIPIYIKYKEAIQICKIYGDKFIKQINKNTNRLHANWHCIGTNTARVSCGNQGEDSINLLNISADALTRSCFIAEEGNCWISIDYSGQETYLMASISNDKAIIDELTNGSGDIHSLTAYMSYPEIPRDTPIKEIKKKFHELRQNAKGIEFSINYGGNAYTISNNKNIPLSEAKQIYNNYMKGFKGLKQYQDFRRQDWIDKGYILLNPWSKYKVFIPEYESLMKDLQWYETLDKNYYYIMKKEHPECDTVQRVSEMFKKKGDLSKQSINYPIQHAGALCSKMALINFFNWIVENNLFNIVKITIIPYDEINCEAPKDIAEKVAQKLYDCMLESGAMFCTRCKLDADMSRLPDGTLPTYWIH